MKFQSIEIENFRSIREKIYLSEKTTQFLTLVGANNIGKSNILRAINLFFNNEVEPGTKFDATIDLNQGSQKATIAITLVFSKNDDRKITTYIDQRHSKDFRDYIVPITLLYKPNGTLQHSFSTVKGQRKSLPELLERIREYVDCIYIPAIKDYRTIIDSQMMRKIVGATFQGWGRGLQGSRTIGEQKEKFRKLLGEIQTVLDESGDYVSEIVTSVVPSIKKFSFSLPYNNLEDFLGRLIFKIEETHLKEAITLGNVGSGVQSFSIYSMLRLLNEIRPTNTYKKSKFLWLIEEPETFMHHDLQRKTFDKLKEYSKEGHIFITTHSPVFLEKRHFDSSYLITHEGSTVATSITSKNIREVIAENLGVSLHDFMEFKRYNLLVEGDTDRDLLLGLNQLFSDSGTPDLIDAKETALLPCGSANGIPHFHGLYSAFNKYADFLGLFDRDPSGAEARTTLIGKGVAKENLFLIPESSFKAACSIEDIVDKPVWDKCVGQLDADGLIEVISKQGVITDYSFEPKNRVEVKKRFVKYLLEHAKKDLAPFKKYGVLLGDIAKRFKEVGV